MLLENIVKNVILIWHVLLMNVDYVTENLLLFVMIIHYSNPKHVILFVDEMLNYGPKFWLIQIHLSVSSLIRYYYNSFFYIFLRIYIYFLYNAILIFLCVHDRLCKLLYQKPKIQKIYL